MPTTISTPSNTLAKMRFQEPYVSEGLNKKLNGVIPRGIVRGGLLVTAGAGLNVRVDADPVSGDSVYSYIDANGHQLTFRQVGNVTLDLTPDAVTTVYVCLYVEYTTSTATVVEWRTYTEAELISAPVAEAPYLIVVGRVVVPGAGPITASAVTPSERREAWDAISRPTVPWHQIVENGRFDLADPGAITIAEQVMGWIFLAAVFGSSRVWTVSTTAPNSGPHELEVDGGAGVTDVEEAKGARRYPVEVGTKVRARYFVRGNTWLGITAGGAQGVRLNWYDTDMQLLSSTDTGDDSLSGTFGYTEIDEIVEAPALAAFVGYSLILDPNGASPTGKFFWDDVRVFVQSDEPLETDLPQRQAFDAIRANIVEMAPDFGFTDIDEFVALTLRLFRLTGVSGDPSTGEATYGVGRMGGGASGRVHHNFLKASMTVPGQIRALGGDWVGVDTEAESPRIKAAVANSATCARTLIYESTAATNHDLLCRMYFATDSGIGSDVEAIEFTINCKWDESLATWAADSAGAGTDNSAQVIQIWRRGIRFFNKSDTTTPWASTAWDGAGANGVSIDLNSWQGRADLNDGVIYLSNPAVTGSNPIATDAVLENALYAKSLVKAWGQVDIDAGVLQVAGDPSTTSGGFGVTSYALTDANTSVTVTFQNAFADIAGGAAVGYAILTGVEGARMTVQAQRVGNTSFKLFLYDEAADAGILTLNGGGITLQIFWAILGHNT